MYRKKNRQVQVEEITISLEKLVAENHILIDKTIDFSFIYEEVEGLYRDKGRPRYRSCQFFQNLWENYVRRFAGTDIFERIFERI